jgi:hypothetical protein
MWRLGSFFNLSLVSDPQITSPPFIHSSAGDDSVVKVWDTRSFKEPVARCVGHKG